MNKKSKNAGLSWDLVLRSLALKTNALSTEQPSFFFFHSHLFNPTTLKQRCP